MGASSAIVFDWYNTLCAPSAGDFWPRVPQLIHQAGGAPSEDAIRVWEADHPLEHREHSISETRYRAWQRQRFERLLAACAVSTTSASELADHVEQLRYARRFDIFDDVGTTLRELRRRGHVIGLCSNWDWDLDRHLVANGIVAEFDFVLCSAVVGYRKPHPAIFECVRDACGQVADIFFVGDTWRDDVRAAATAGFVPIHLVRGEACEREGDDHAEVACINSLPQLLSLL